LPIARVVALQGVKAEATKIRNTRERLGIVQVCHSVDGLHHVESGEGSVILRNVEAPRRFVAEALDQRFNVLRGP
jgi:hypothetical protein